MTGDERLKAGYPVDSLNHKMLFFIKDTRNASIFDEVASARCFIPSPLMGEG
jgi:hypothetical protein